MAFRPRDRVVTVADPVGSVVSLADMRLHLRADPNDTSENALIVACEAAAVAGIERATQRLLIARTVTLRLPSLPMGRMPIELPGGRVASVTSVTVEGDPIAGTSALGESPALLVPTADWPVVTAEGYPVVIVYQAGFASAPPDLVAAVKLWAAHLFAHREAVAASVTEVPLTVQALIAPHRITPA